MCGFYTTEGEAQRMNPNVAEPSAGVSASQLALSLRYQMARKYAEIR